MVLNEPLQVFHCQRFLWLVIYFLGAESPDCEQIQGMVFALMFFLTRLLTEDLFRLIKIYASWYQKS